ncbi:hypothetical protein AB1J06_09550 [Agrobacterium tumefaciens]|uniref:hypothetical protein n=1 Tax=Agrobacterium tumefaciens TaxID=358 RepID=UPI00345A3C8F
MTSKRQIPAAFAKGYVLCSPSGKLQQKTWSETAAKAIASKYRKRETWEKAQSRGWSVQFVYVRFFIPVFKATFTTTEISEAHNDEDI